MDIVNFYPSITEKLFNEAINFARKLTPITDETIEIIKNARKSLLFSMKRRGKKHQQTSMSQWEPMMVQKYVSWLDFLF